MSNLIDKQIEILRALKEGKVIEWAHKDDTPLRWEMWRGSGEVWDWSSFVYRVKKEPRTLTLWRLANSNMGWRVSDGGYIHPAHETMVVREVLDD